MMQHQACMRHRVAAGMPRVRAACSRLAYFALCWRCRSETNIFAGAWWPVDQIGDMGISKIMGTMTNFATTLVGTPYYLSPELCEGLSYNEKSDMWALGIVLYECCTCGKKPFDAESLGPLVMQIMHGVYTSIEGYSSDLIEIIDGLLCHDMGDRLDTYALLNSAAVRGKAEELGLDLTLAARDLSAVEIESSVARLGFSGSSSAADSKLPGKGAPRIVARYGHGSELHGLVLVRVDICVEAIRSGVIEVRGVQSKS